MSRAGDWPHEHGDWPHEQGAGLGTGHMSRAGDWPHRRAGDWPHRRAGDWAYGLLRCWEGCNLPLEVPGGV